MNKKAKENRNRNEYKTMRHLETLGYVYFRIAASKGVFDVTAISKADVLLVQVKSNRMPGQTEIKTIENFDSPTNARKLIHVWKDRKGLPLIREIKKVKQAFNN